MYQPDRIREHHRIKQLSLCVALAIPALASAQQPSDTSPDALPEIVVKAPKQRDTTEGSGSYTTTGKSRTATPLGLSLRDTPQSVSVVTQQRIEDQGMLTVTDAVKYVTGVSVNQYETNRAQFTARGFDINALMIDGVPTTWEQPWSSGEVTSSLAMYDRVEVVRGATGLTTGAGDPSAAINLVRKRASSKEFTGKVEADIGSWNQRRVMGDLSTALNEAKTLRTRVVAEHSERDSWVDNLKNKSQSVYATLEADVGRNTLLSAGFGRQENKTKGPMWGGLPPSYDDGTDAHWDRSKSTAAKWTRWDSTYDNAFVTLEHRFDNDWRVKASYSQGDRLADSHLLFLYGNPNQATGAGMWTFPGSYRMHTKQADVSLQASGPFKLLGRTHELVLGYTYSRQESLAQNRTGADGAVDNFNTWDGSYAEPTWGPLSYYGESTVTQKAAYAATRLSLTDQLKLILGARVTNYIRSGDEYNTEPFTMTVKREVTPYAGVIFDLNDTYSLYASHTDIFQPQAKRDMQGNYLAPITGKATELGIKGEYLDGRLNASAAIFRIRQDNLAQGTGLYIPGTSPAEPAYVAAQGATSKGFELELSGELTQGWNATVGYSQFKAEDAKGVDVNSVYPRKLLRLFTTYRLPGALNALTIGGGVNWQSSTYLYVASLARNIDQGAYALVDLMARYAISRDLSAQLNVNNVFDKTYYGMFETYNQFTYGAPRNATLSLQYKF